MYYLFMKLDKNYLKFQLISMENRYVEAEGIVGEIGTKESFVFYKRPKIKENLVLEKPIHNFEQVYSEVSKLLLDTEYGAVGALSQIRSIGLQIIHDEVQISGLKKLDPSNYEEFKFEKDGRVANYQEQNAVKMLLKAFPQNSVMLLSNGKDSLDVSKLVCNCKENARNKTPEMNIVEPYKNRCCVDRFFELVREGVADVAEQDLDFCKEIKLGRGDRKD